MTRSEVTMVKALQNTGFVVRDRDAAIAFYRVFSE